MRGGVDSPSILERVSDSLGFSSPSNSSMSSSMPISDTPTSVSSEKMKSIGDSFQNFVNDIANNVADVIVAKTRAVGSEHAAVAAKAVADAAAAAADEQAKMAEVDNEDAKMNPSMDVVEESSPQNEEEEEKVSSMDLEEDSVDQNNALNGEGDFNNQTPSMDLEEDSVDQNNALNGEGDFNNQSSMSPIGMNESPSPNYMSNDMSQSSQNQPSLTSPIAINESASPNYMSNDMTQSDSSNEMSESMNQSPENKMNIGGYSVKRNKKSKRRRVQPKRRTHKGRVLFRGL